MKKRGFLEFLVFSVLFLVVCIPFSVADAFAQEENVEVKHVNSEVLEPGKFGRIKPISFNPDYIANTETSLSLSPLTFLAITGSIILLSINIKAIILLSILMLPIVSKKVKADLNGIEAGSFRVKGSQTDIVGYANTTESLTFTARLGVTGDADITPNQLKLYDEARLINQNFTCIPQTGNEFVCNLQNVPSYCPAEDFTLALYNDTGSIVGPSRTANLLCDLENPSITVSLDKSLYGGSDIVNISYSLTDTACIGYSFCVNRCSGFRTITIEGAGYSNTTNILGAVDTCSYSGYSLVPVSSFTPVNSLVNLTITVTDNVGNEGSAETGFIVDLTPPVITDLKITKAGNIVSYVPNGTLTFLNISVNITDDYTINTTSIQGNFSELGIAGGWQAKDSCTPSSGNSMICTWANENVTLTQDTSGKLYFRANDSNGNLGEEELDFSLMVYTGSPNLAINKTDCINQDGDNCITNPILTTDEVYFVMNISSTLPVAKENVIGDFSDINTGEGMNALEADSCSLDGDYWMCDWAININRAMVNANITFSAANLAGGADSDYLIIDVYTEAQAPIEIFTFEGNDRSIIPLDREVIINRGTELVTMSASFWLRYLNTTDPCNGNVEIVGELGYQGNCEYNPRFWLGAKSNNDYPGFMQLEADPSSSSIEGLDYVEFGLPEPCQLKFNVVCDGELHPSVVSNVSLRIPVKNETPTSQEELKDQIKDITTFVNTTKFINGLERIFALANKFCSLKSVIGSALLAWVIISEGAAACVDTEIGRLTGICDAVTQGSIWSYLGIKTGLKQLFNAIDVACSTVGCTSAKMGIPLPERFGTNLSAFLNIGKPTLCDLLKIGSLNSLTRQNASHPVLGGIAQGLSDTDTLTLAKKSWIFSLGCLCIPGMIYNFNKIRQMACWRAVCYRDYIPTGYFTKSDCDDINKYNWCVYGLGQGTVFIDILVAPLKAIVSIFEHPVASILAFGWTIAKNRASDACDTSKVECITGAGACSVSWLSGCGVEAVMILAESLANSYQIFETLRQLLPGEGETFDMSMFQQQDDHCKRLLEGYEIPEVGGE